MLIQLLAEYKKENGLRIVYVHGRVEMGDVAASMNRGVMATSVPQSACRRACVALMTRKQEHYKKNVYD